MLVLGFLLVKTPLESLHFVLYFGASSYLYLLPIYAASPPYAICKLPKKATVAMVSAMALIANATEVSRTWWSSFQIVITEVIFSLQTFHLAIHHHIYGGWYPTAEDDGSVRLTSVTFF